MTCVCSLAGTAACKTCLHNPGGGNFNNYVTWTTPTYVTGRHVKHRTIEDVLRDLLHDTAHYFPSDCEDDIAKAAEEIRGLL